MSKVTYSRIRRTRKARVIEVFVDGGYVGEFRAALKGVWNIDLCLLDEEKGKDFHEVARCSGVYVSIRNLKYFFERG